jgi:hypothetical protein
MSPSHSPVPEDDARRALRADCSTCFALCCAALGFRRSADFPAEAEARATAPDSVDEATGLARRIDRLLDGTPTEILAVDADATWPESTCSVPTSATLDWRVPISPGRSSSRRRR